MCYSFAFANERIIYNSCQYSELTVGTEVRKALTLDFVQNKMSCTNNQPCINLEMSPFDVEKWLLYI